MRFPIRSQILLPTSVVMSAVVLGSAAVSTWMAQRSAKARIEKRIDDVSQILRRASFPLSDLVLEQMSGLTGAEFVLVDATGTAVAASEPSFGLADVSSPTDPPGVLGEMRNVAGNQYFHRVLPLNSLRQQSDLQLHAFFAADEYRRIWQRALFPSLIAAGTTLAAALACAFWVGVSVSRSTRAIIEQLRRLSGGHFQPALLPARNDELRDIAQEINRTASLLEKYESDVRDGERMKTMVAMGAGLAHQLRNSATGCRMALDIHAEETDSADDEAMQVARRQLSLMQNYLQRFLLLAKVEPNRTKPQIADLNEIVSQAVALVRHSANHLRVELQWKPTAGMLVEGDVISIEQSIVNLLLNAIEAACTLAAACPTEERRAQVRIAVQRHDARRASIVVADNGAGPNDEQDVFAPFVTSKASGVGLGLAVVKDVAKEHGGSASWRRQEGWTEFVIELPLAAERT